MADEPQDKGNGDEVDPNQVIQDLSSKIGELPEAMQTAVIGGLRTALAQSQAAQADDEEDDEDSEVLQISADDLERMSRADLVNYLSQTFGAGMQNALKPLTKELEELRLDTDRRALKTDFENVRAKNADFDEWKEELGAIARRYPELSIDDMLKLARQSDPEKTAKLQEGKKRADAIAEFGGLRPGGGPASTPVTNMDPQAALDAAFEETLGKLPPGTFEANN